MIDYVDRQSAGGLVGRHCSIGGSFLHLLIQNTTFVSLPNRIRKQQASHNKFSNGELRSKHLKNLILSQIVQNERFWILLPFSMAQPRSTE